MEHRISSNIAAGIERVGNHYKVALITLQRDQISVNTTYTTPTSNEEGVNPLYTEATPTNLLNKAVLVTAIEGCDVLVRPLEVKLTRPRDIDAVVCFQAEPLLPYPLDEAIIEWVPCQSTEEGTRLTVLAARKEHLTEHLSALKEDLIDPEVVSCTPAALAAFARLFAPIDAVTLIHVGWNQTTCALVCEGQLQTSFGINIGTKNFAEALAKEARLSDAEACEILFKEVACTSSLEEKHPKLASTLQAFHKQVSRVVVAMDKTTTKSCPSATASPVVIVGDGALIDGFAETLAQAVKKELFLPESDDLNSQQDLCSFAVPLGLALSGVSEGSISFRQEEFRYPRPWKHQGRALATFGVLSLLITLLILWSGAGWAHRHTASLRNDYTTLLATYDTTPEDFEGLFLKKNPSLKKEGGFSLKKLTRQDLRKRLSFVDKLNKETPQNFALQPQVPRVSDLLAWLHTHPQVIKTDTTSGKLQSQIQLQNLTYTMVKRPDATHPREHYGVKVDLEFTAETPRAAREFHDALIAPNNFVDPKGEVKWGSSRGLYRTAFFLKDKTAYPQTGKREAS